MDVETAILKLRIWGEASEFREDYNIPGVQKQLIEIADLLETIRRGFVHGNATD